MSPRRWTCNTDRPTKSSWSPEDCCEKSPDGIACKSIPCIGRESRRSAGTWSSRRVHRTESSKRSGSQTHRVSLSACNGIRNGSLQEIHFLARCSPLLAKPRAQQLQRCFMASSIQQFLKEHGISEVEAIIPDMAGRGARQAHARREICRRRGHAPARGDLPADGDRRLSGRSERHESVGHRHRVEGGSENGSGGALGRGTDRPGDPRLLLRRGRPVTMAPRYVLRRVLDLYEAHGWEPVVAPELEFFLVEPNVDSDYPLKPPVGRSGRPEIGRQAYSIEQYVWVLCLCVIFFLVLYFIFHQSWHLLKTTGVYAQPSSSTVTSPDRPSAALHIHLQLQPAPRRRC